jgi:hypothetical protein
MSEKLPVVVIEVEDFPAFLKGSMGEDSVTEYAAKIGVKTQMVYMMMSGARTPSPAILKRMKLRVAYVKDQTTPAKARAKKKE